jgi:hypothetical protein
MVLEKILNDKAIPATFKQCDIWCSVTAEFLNIVPPKGRVATIKLAPTISHCCRLGCEVRSKRNKLSRAQLKEKRNFAENNTLFKTNDGLLHYAPYRVVIAPSFRFYETLCVAEQGYASDSFHQHPVFHSVIPNSLAKQYDTEQIYPAGVYDDVVVSDYYSYISVTLPYEKEDLLFNFMVRRVLIKFSTDYQEAPAKGSCCLSDKQYFRSCFRIFDEEWENSDISNDVDVCLITGQPGPNDKGQNEILLSGRIYASGFEIPYSTDEVKNKFLRECLATINKKGFETQRLGGSAGNEGATADHLLWFKKNRGCFPTIAGAVIHVPTKNGNWKAVYITPYQKNKKDMVSVHQYSSPKIGGQMKWKPKIHDIFPEFFDTMSKVRSTTSRILISLKAKCHINISPRAASVQEMYNEQARKTLSHGSSTTMRPIDILNQQIVYSFVAYTVGNHKDVTKSGVSRELIECKACLKWPAKSVVGTQVMPALGRGGAGSGIYTVMIVDHPSKKAK